MFPHGFYKIFNNTYFVEHLRISASTFWRSVIQNDIKNLCKKMSLYIQQMYYIYWVYISDPVYVHTYEQ